MTERTTTTQTQENAAGPELASARVLQIGAFRLNRDTRKLSLDGKSLRLQRRPKDVLLFLAERHHRMVTRQELLDTFWPRVSGDEALTRCISTIRKVLRDTGDPPEYLETIWGEGYRLIAPVTAVTDTGQDVFPESPELDRARSTTDSSEESPAPRTVPRPRWLLLALLVLAVAWLATRLDDRTPEGLDVDFIAVLPIEAGFEEDWVAPTMTDHLIRIVSRIEGISVVASASVTPFTTASDPRLVRERLGVDAVLTSSIDRLGARARLQSQLVSAVDGSVLWTFQTSLREEVVDEAQILELADAVARRLWASLQLRESELRVNPAAYRDYLRGRYYWGQRTFAGLEAAITSFNSALEKQPDYVDAMTGLADAWLLMPLYGAAAPAEAIPKARIAAEQALAQDELQAHAHAVIGVIEMQFEWDWEEGETRLRQAVTLNPNDSTAIQWLGELHCYQKRFDHCRRFYQLASGLDPLSPIIRMIQGSPDLYSGAYDRAIESYRTTLRDTPEFTFTHVGLGHALAGRGDWQAAIASYEAVLPEVGLPIVGGPLVYCLARAGLRSRARALLAELEELAASRYVPPTKLAIAHIGLDQPEQAIDYLRQAIEARDDRLVYLAVDPFYRPLHGLPAFDAIAEEVGLLDELSAP